ncbi:MAG: hypothetical protein QNJ72_17125 [Pleurocapsa sp. MO_226.B13]|nr:hypothetical protein [Pleurocapsa sp. MO_226.B13]
MGTISKTDSNLNTVKPMLNTIIYGQIINMLYLQDDDLASIIIQEKTQDNSEGNMFILAHKPDYPNVNSETNIVEINNLNSFRTRLQEAFNYNSLVNIYCENNNQIKSLVIVAKSTLEEKVLPLDGGNVLPFDGGGGSDGPLCLYGSPPCKP